MRKSILTCVVVVCVCGAQSRETTGRNDDWKEFRSKEANFRCLFPSDPQISVNKGGAVDMKTFMVDLRDRAYSVLMSDVPGAQFENEKQTNDRLEGAVKGASTNLKLEKQGKITIGGMLLGREILGANNQGVIVRARFFLINGRLYQVIVGGNREFVNGPEATKFLDSFMLSQ